MTIEQVKELFKDVKEVKCAYANNDKAKVNLSNLMINCWDNSVFFKDKNGTPIYLWCSKNGLAEIVSYKKKKMNKYKKYIKDAYNGKLGLSMCSEWKQAIKKEFPKLVETKNKLEVGKWYKLLENYGCLEKGMVFQFLKYQSFCEKFAIVDHYAFGIKNKNYLAPRTKDLTPATDKEVEQALIKEAKRRGLLEHNTIINTGVFSDSTQFEEYEISPHFKDNTLYMMKGEIYPIFKNGKWAEVITPPKEIEHEGHTYVLKD